MSNLAKVFVVLNLVLALCFLAASATVFQTQVNWKAEAEKSDRIHKQDLARWKDMKEDLDGRNTTLKENNQVLDSRNARLDSENKDLNNQIGDLRKEVAETKAKIGDLEGRIAAKDEHLQQKDEELACKSETIETLTDRESRAQEAKKSAEMDRARAVLAKDQLAKQLTDTSKELAGMREKNEDLALLVAHFQKTGISPVVVPSQIAPPLDGQVVKVAPDVNLVILSIGSDDGVEKGHEFTIYRGDRFVAKVRVENLLADMCSAEILYREKDAAIAVGDKATTRLIN
ncbi:MAG: hypothetical protein ACE5GW_07060 [Planctomycetota bacterium]